jgi:uncharacterized protein
MAAMNGNLEVARTLVEAGANVNTKDKNGNTAFKYAKDRNFLRIVLLLKSAGAHG